MIIRTAKINPVFVILPLLVALCACNMPTQKEQAPSGQPLRTSGYTYSCWLNGWRKHKTDLSPEILAIQASAYSFTLNLANVSKAGFGLTSTKPLSYADALKTGTDFVYQLPPAELLITINVGGETYRAVSCAAGTDTDPRRLGLAKMWESGRFVQHFELVDLKFQNTTGKTLGCKGNLSLVAWPDSLTFSTALVPDTSTPDGWRDTLVTIQLKGNNLDCRAEKAYTGQWTPATTNVLTVTYNVKGRITSDQGLTVQVSSGTNNVFPVAFETAKNCFVANAPKIKRTFKTGYTDVRD